MRILPDQWEQSLVCVCVFRYDVSTPSEKLYNNLESPSWHWLLSNLEYEQIGESCCQIRVEIVAPLGYVSGRRHISDQIRLEQIKSY